MKSTRDMLRKAAEVRPAQKVEKQAEFQPVCPMPAVSEEVHAVAAPQRAMVPRPIRENSVYRQLMRSHDRMSTRHLKG